MLIKLHRVLSFAKTRAFEKGPLHRIASHCIALHCIASDAKITQMCDQQSLRPTRNCLFSLVAIVALQAVFGLEKENFQS